MTDDGEHLCRSLPAIRLFPLEKCLDPLPILGAGIFICFFSCFRGLKEDHMGGAQPTREERRSFGRWAVHVPHAPVAGPPRAHHTAGPPH